MTTDRTIARDVAAASAEYGMQPLANWLPAERHAMLRSSSRT